MGEVLFGAFCLLRNVGSSIRDNSQKSKILALRMKTVLNETSFGLQELVSNFGWLAESFSTLDELARTIGLLIETIPQKLIESEYTVYDEKNLEGLQAFERIVGISKINNIEPTNVPCKKRQSIEQAADILENGVSIMSYLNLLLNSLINLFSCPF
jgi:hypothetical protein